MNTESALLIGVLGILVLLTLFVLGEFSLVVLPIVGLVLLLAYSETPSHKEVKNTQSYKEYLTTIEYLESQSEIPVNSKEIKIEKAEINDIDYYTVTTPVGKLGGDFAKKFEDETKTFIEIEEIHKVVTSSEVKANHYKVFRPDPTGRPLDVTVEYTEYRTA